MSIIPCGSLKRQQAPKLPSIGLWLDTSESDFVLKCDDALAGDATRIAVAARPASYIRSPRTTTSTIAGGKTFVDNFIRNGANHEDPAWNTNDGLFKSRMDRVVIVFIQRSIFTITCPKLRGSARRHHSRNPGCLGSGSFIAGIYIYIYI